MMLKKELADTQSPKTDNEKASSSAVNACKKALKDLDQMDSGQDATKE